MTEEYLQVAFEVKATCDEISRRLLRWHWEQRPGARGFDALLEHIARRREESPEYYDRLPDLEGKTSWQQLDTTVCMRVLLDQETDAARPLDLLGNTAHPAAARRACNAVRTARNEAAHASDRAGAQQAAALFNEAVECLEEGYANSALSEAELARYYRRAQDFLTRVNGEEEDSGDSDLATQTAPAAAKPRRKSAQAAEVPAAQKPRTGTSTSRTKRAAPAAAKAPRTGSAKQPPARRAAKREKKRSGEEKALAFLLLASVIIGLTLRACSMGL